jgi:hypothetical protein
MFRSLLRPQIIKRFCHTHSRTIIKENKKSTDELLIEQNKQLCDVNKNLHKLWENGQDTKLYIIGIRLVIIFIKPTK